MKPSVFVSTKKSLSRRHFLRNASVGMALPLLEAMLPAFSKASETLVNNPPKRMLGICNNLGLLPEKFFPNLESKGFGYELSPYLNEIKAFRNKFTVMSGVWHPDVDGGHPADNCFLTAAPHPGNAGFRNTISLDQYAAEHIGHLTRFPSLTLGVNVAAGSRSLSWTGAGVLIPCESKSSEIFKKLFFQGSPQQIAAQERKLKIGESIMDVVGEQAKSLEKSVSRYDRERLDQYFTGVRDLERRLEKSREWERKPKPKVDVAVPTDPQTPAEYMEKVRLMYDMAALAFETDSTRLITLMLDSVNSPALEIEGHDIKDGYHSLSHHGKSAEKLRQLEGIDVAHMQHLNRLFARLDARKEGGQTLLDHSMILYGSNLGNANTHVTTNLPVLFAGGGFKHGQHLAFDTQNNYPLPNLFVSMLQKMGLPVDKFATSTGTMRGLDFA